MIHPLRPNFQWLDRSRIEPWLLFLLIFFTVHVESQTLHVNQLKTALENAGQGKERVSILIQLGEKLGASDYSTAIYYLQEALGLSKQLNDQRGQADALLHLGIVYFYKDEPLFSFSYFEKAKLIYENINCAEGLADEAFARGRLHNLISEPIQAIQAFQKAIEWEEATNDIWGISRGYHLLARVHLMQKNIDLAMHYARETMAIKKELNDSSGIANVYITIGNIFEEKSELDSALICYQASLDIRRKSGNIRRIANSLSAIGSINAKKGKFDQAIEAFNESAGIYEKLEEKTGFVTTQLKLSEVYCDRGEFDQSLKIARDALVLCEELGYPNLISNCYKHMTKLFTKNQQYEEAFEHQKLFIAIDDSIFNVEKARMFDELELKYQTEKKANDLVMLASKNKLQKKSLILLSLLLLTAAAFIALLYIFLRQKTKLLQHKNALLKHEKVTHEKDNAIFQKEKKQLSNALELKNKELTTKVLSMQKTNETLELLAGKLNNLSNHLNGKDKLVKEIHSVAGKLENLAQVSLWEEFDEVFKGVYNDFYDHLLEECPNLTPTEIKTAALLKMNLNTKDISAITFKSESGIKSARYRLRKKLNLSSDDSLVAYLMKL